MTSGDFGLQVEDAPGRLGGVRVIYQSQEVGDVLYEFVAVVLILLLRLEVVVSIGHREPGLIHPKAVNPGTLGVRIDVETEGAGNPVSLQ